MHFGPRGHRWLIAPLLLLAILLGVMATLQYRWLGQVRDAERGRDRAQLEFAARRSADELSQQVRRVYREFVGPEDGDAARLRRQWLRDSVHPDLAGAIHVASLQYDTWSLQRLDPQSEISVDVPWPAEFEPLRRQLDSFVERGPEQAWPGPLFAPVPAVVAVQRPADPFAIPGRAIIITLDRGVLATILRERLAANYAAAHAGGLDAALLAGDSVLARTSKGWPDGKQAADFIYTFRPAPPPPRIQPVSTASPGDELWRLSVRRQGVGLEAMLTASHRRNLALALITLLMLIASAVLLIVLLRRGEHLRTQQAQFVAAMSHELNTPLAILRIASENLHDGITHDPDKVSRYVRTIARETANLSEMVNDVLELAGMNAGVPTVGDEVVDAGAVVEEAVMRARLSGRGDAIDFDVDIDRHLPPVQGNAQALSRAVQNLVTNAMRHGAAGKWVGVRVTREDARVRIAVEDRGPGIDPADAGHVFEPFYRGVASGSVRGTGLGLAIVKQIVTDHGGSVSISVRRGGGAAFLIELPARAEHE